MSSSPALAGALDELAELVAAKVLAKLSAPTTHYSTASKSGTLPPGKSRAWALRNLKLVPGARKVGRDWVVSIADFEAWLSEQDSIRFAKSGERAVVREAIATEDELDRLATAGLTRAGLRRVR